VLQRYPELQALGVIEIVPASQLAAYARRALRNQSTPFQLVPAGRRPFYCMFPIGLSRPGAPVLPRDYDVCATPLGTLITSARRSGRSEVLPYNYLGKATIALETPYYRGGGIPSSIAARTQTFVRIVALSLVPDVILRQALIGHPDTAVALRFGTSTSTMVFRSGAAAPNAQTATVNLHDGWILAATGVGKGGGLFGDVNALALLIGGIIFSLMLGVLNFLLGTGRTRLKVLVAQRTDQLKFQAMHDSLTGLPNRGLIVDRIDQLLGRNRRNETMGAALYVDLDDFKNVNDSLGHDVGDQLLVAVAERMSQALREVDTIGRMGGDEFVVLVDGGEHVLAPEIVAQRLLNVMRQPFHLDGVTTPLAVSTSIGVAIGDRANGGELLRDADVALYQAKARGKNQFVFFDPEMQSVIGRRIELEFDLRSALVGEQFYLLYQPIYNLEDLAIVGVEALLRWQHPTQGVIQPDEFIPILERTGQIREVGGWVLTEACRQTAAWHALGDKLDISVNVSRRQLDSDLIVTQIEDALAASGLDVARLIVEVTETALMQDVESAIARLRAIKALGVRIAIDDFGTGYSSLGYLQQFPVDCLKIDKSFTSTITDSSESKALVKTFIQLGRDLGLTTLAEGVETVGQMDVLRDSHVAEVQGFLFSRPLQPDVLESQILEPLRTTEVNRPPFKN
jgi:diguanylate cyclase (GGDEF)-like protein